MKRLQSPPNLHQGFSLVEMLTVVAVMGLIAAIAIPSLGKVNDGAKRASSQRNAQNLVSVFAAGAAAGIKWAGTDRNTKIQAVVTGAVALDGAFAGRLFQVPNISGNDLTDTYPFIGSDTNGDLFYDEAGVQTST